MGVFANYLGEEEAKQPTTPPRMITFLDYANLIDKTLKQAQGWVKIQKTILKDPEKLKEVASLILGPLRVNVGQNQVTAEKTRVQNRIAFYQQLMPLTFWIRILPANTIAVLRGGPNTLGEKGANSSWWESPNTDHRYSSPPCYFLSSANGTVTNGKITDDLFGDLDVTREAFFYRRGEWAKIESHGIDDLIL